MDRSRGGSLHKALINNMCYQFPLRLQNASAGGRGLLPPQGLQTSLLWGNCGEGAFQPAAASAEMTRGSSRGVPLPLQLQPALGGWNQSSPARLDMYQAAGDPEPLGLTLQPSVCAEDSRHVLCLAVSWVLSGVWPRWQHPLGDHGPQGPGRVTAVLPALKTESRTATRLHFPPFRSLVGRADQFPVPPKPTSPRAPSAVSSPCHVSASCQALCLA